MTWRTDLIEQAAQTAYEGGFKAGQPHEPWEHLGDHWRKTLCGQIERALPVIADAISERGWSAGVAAEMRGKDPAPIHDPDDYDGDLFGGMA